MVNSFDVKYQAKGRWREIILGLTSVTSHQLDKRHQSCPFCGGKDRYRFDDYLSDGNWFCNRACSGRQSSNGFGFLMMYFNEDFNQVYKRVKEYLK